MFPGETVATGAPGPDQDPSIDGPKVMQSGAGFYIGYSQHGMPYSRESLRYYATREIAQAALDSDAWERRG